MLSNIHKPTVIPSMARGYHKLNNRADSHVSVPSTFRLLSVRMVCVHTVRRVQSLSSTARDRRPAIIAVRYAARCHGMHFP
jgi:hypothetical protein